MSPGRFANSLLMLMGALLILPSQAAAGAANPTLDQQIGQLLMVGFRGTELPADHWVLNALRQGRLGGVILFDRDLQYPGSPRNIVSSEQLKKLTSQLRSAASFPVLIAIDQEGGKVARLNSAAGFPSYPGHRQLGRWDDPQRTGTVAGEIAATLAQHGFNLNLAPVVDLCSNPDNPVIARLGRCFSAAPRRVTQHAAAWIRAHRRQGVLTAVKHFPGHGSSRGDSHLGFVDISTSWSRDELIPYRQLTQQGLIDLVMTAHVVHRQFDSDYPATLSSAVLQGLLRDEIGFRGPVLTDDLQMAAIRDHYSFDETVWRAISAGSDLLLFGNNLVYDEQVIERVHRAVREALGRGDLTRQQLERAYQRIQQVKAQLDHPDKH